MKIIILFLLTINLSAHPGRTASDGCHYCRTNCSKWEIPANERHCHRGNKKSSPSKRLVSAKPKQLKYSRKLFGKWLDSDRDCQDQRAEILIERSLVPVGFKKSSKGPKCLVGKGKWRDFYYNEVLTHADKIDIDHVVPLKHAFDMGANRWTRAKRELFANDKDNLVITNSKYNRSKGAQTPLTWMPINREYACKYMKRWKKVKLKYNLPIAAEFEANYKRAKCGEKHP